MRRRGLGGADADNVACRFLQANAYQRARLRMYEELHEAERAKAAKRKKLVLD